MVIIMSLGCGFMLGIGACVIKLHRDKKRKEEHKCNCGHYHCEDK